MRFVLLTSNHAFYTWTENQAGRGENEISSAVHHYLCNTEFPDECGTMRLFADGCGGQNKNSHVIHALAMWLLKDPPTLLKNVIFVFPVRGHSYLPADRVFGRVEKELKKHATIVLPDDYVKLYSKMGA